MAVVPIPGSHSIDKDAHLNSARQLLLEFEREGVYFDPALAHASILVICESHADIQSVVCPRGAV